MTRRSDGSGIELRAARALPLDTDMPDSFRHYGDTVNRYALTRVERRVGFSIFGRWLGYESMRTERRVETLQLEHGPRTDVPPPRQGVFGWPLGAAAGLLLGIVAVGALTRPAEPEALHSASVLAPLPPPLPVAPRPTRKAHIVAPVEQPLPPQPSKSGKDIEAKITAEPGTASAALTLAQARRRALAFGEPTAWAEGDSHGMVVPGVEQPSEGRLCRTTAVFTRTDGDRGSASSTRECRDAPAAASIAKPGAAH